MVVGPVVWAAVRATRFRLLERAWMLARNGEQARAERLGMAARALGMWIVRRSRGTVWP